MELWSGGAVELGNGGAGEPGSAVELCSCGAVGLWSRVKHKTHAHYATDCARKRATTLWPKEANMYPDLKTKHGVPILKQPTGVSGSIVLRSIRERVEWDALAQELAKDAARAAKKRALGSDA